MDSFQKTQLMFIWNADWWINQAFDKKNQQFTNLQQSTKEFTSKLLNGDFNTKLNNLIYSYLINEIIKFMKINKIHQQFITNLKTYYNINNFNDIITEMINNDIFITDMISGTFVWDETKEGMTFWSNINKQFLSFIFCQLNNFYENKHI